MEVGSGISSLGLVLSVHSQVCRRHLLRFFPAMLFLPTLTRAANGAVNHRAHCM